MRNYDNNSKFRINVFYCITLIFLILSVITKARGQTAPNISYSSTAFLLQQNVSATLTHTNTGGSVPVNYYRVSTYTGVLGTAGATNGTLAQATFSNPYGVVFLANGDMLVADSVNEVIRKITPSGTVSTYAGAVGVIGTTNGTLTAARFSGPGDLCQDASGNIYVLEANNHCVRKITPAGVVSTFAGSPGNSGTTNGTGTAARFYNPKQMDIDSDGNLYVADFGNHTIRKITPTAVVTTFAGSPGSSGSTNATGTSARFDSPFGVTIDASNNLYVTDYNNSTIRKITSAGVVTTLAGAAGLVGDTNSSGSLSRFDHPVGICIDKSGLFLYVADKNNNLIRRVQISGGTTNTIAGISGTAGSVNGSGTSATFNDIRGLEVDSYGDIYICDLGSQLIRKIEKTQFTITPDLPTGLTFNTSTGLITGTPTVLQSEQNYTVKAVNIYGVSTFTFSIAVIPSPPTASSQSFCSGATVSGLVATGTDLKWYISSTGGTALTTTTALATGTYYVSQTVSGVESDRASVSITVMPPPPSITYSGVNSVYSANIAMSINPPMNSGGGTDNNISTFWTATGTTNITNLAIDTSGNVYVAHEGVIKKISQDGTQATTELSVSGINFISAGITSTGILLAGNTNDGLIYRKSGSTITTYSYLSTYEGKSIAISPTDYVYFAAPNRYGVGQIHNDMSVLSYSNIAPSLLYVNDLATSNTGLIYALLSNGSIRKMTTTGAFVGSSINGYLSQTGIAVDTAGYMYVVDATNGKIYKMDTNGNGRFLIASGSNLGKIRAATPQLIYYTEGTTVKKMLIPYTISPALPTGLSFNPLTGAITGTPTVATANTTYTITAQNNCGISTTTISFGTKFIPTFTHVNGICLGENIAPLPTTSNNGYTGTWSPAINNSATTTYTFTPNDSQNVSTTTMTIVVNKAPSFTYSGVNSNYILNNSMAINPPVNAGGQMIPTNYLVSQYAGVSGTYGAINGPLLQATFNAPRGIKFLSNGNMLVADGGNNLIRKISPGGIVTTFAGDGTYGSVDGTLLNSEFKTPSNLSEDSLGNIYLADYYNNSIRKITSDGIVSTFAGLLGGLGGFADGNGTAARFNNPTQIAIDSYNNLFVTDKSGGIIRKITPNGDVSTIAGSYFASGYTDGIGTNARFVSPDGITIDSANNLYVSSGNTIRKITPVGVVSTIAGATSTGYDDGIGTAALFNNPQGLCYNPSENCLYVADTGNQIIRKIHLSTGKVITIAGIPGSSDDLGRAVNSATFSSPKNLEINQAGELFISDFGNHSISKLTPSIYSITPNLPNGLIFNELTGAISGTPTIVTPYTAYTISAQNECGISTTTIGFATSLVSPTFTQVSPICSGSPLSPLPTTSNNGYTGTWSPVLNNTATTTYTFTPDAGQNVATTTMTITVNQVPTISYTGVNGTYLSTDTITLNATASTGGSPLQKTLVTLPSFNFNVNGIAVGADGYVYVIADNSAVKKMKNDGTQITTVVSGITPLDIVADSQDAIYVGCSNQIIKIVNGIVVSTIVNPLGYCDALAIDSLGNIYVAGNDTIKKMASDGSGVTTIANYSNVNDLAIDNEGYMYIAIGDNWTDDLIKMNTDGTGIVSFGYTVNNAPQSIAVENSTGYLYLTMPDNSYIQIVNKNTGDFVGGLVPGNPGYFHLALDSAGAVYYTNSYVNNTLYKVNPYFTINPTLPSGLHFDGTTGNITGTPNETTPSTTYTVSAQNYCGIGSTTLSFATEVILTEPTFSQVSPICSGSTLTALPTTSNNGYTGTWSPAMNNTETTTYIFTPDVGQNVSSTSMIITVNPIQSPSFTQVAAINSGESLSALPSTSNNGITGTWSPSLNNTATTTYTFTPDAGQCASAVDMSIIVNQSTYSEESVTTCDSYTWNGTTYTQSGDYTFNTTNASGNPHMETLHLTINLSTTTEENITISNSYTWNGTTYTQSGNYTFTNTNANGCINTSILHLSIVNSYAFYLDTDGDGIGYGELISNIIAVDANTPPTGYSLTNTDCSPSDIAVYREGTFYVDADGDNYSVNNDTFNFCYGAAEPAGYSLLNLGVDCDDSIFAVNPGVVEVLYDGVDNNCNGVKDEGYQITANMVNCGSTLSTLSSFIYCVSTPGVNGYRFEVTNTTTNQVQTIDKPTQFFSLTELSSYDYATTYSVRVMVRKSSNNVWLGYYGPACMYSTPPVIAPAGGIGTVQLQTYCGETLPTISTNIATTSLLGATSYRFRITNTTTGAIQTLTRSLHWFSLTMLTSYNYGTTYIIEAAVKTNGNYTNYGAPCSVTTPAVPTLTNYCGGAIVPTKGIQIRTSSLDKVTAYEFTVDRYNASLELVSSSVVVKSLNRFTFNDITNYAPSTTYSVRVRVFTAGTWSPYGDACEIVSPGAAKQGDTKAVDSSLFSVIAYPNPYDYQFSFRMESSSDAPVHVKVYDMIGKLIETREINAADIPVVSLGERYPSGVYNVVVTQEENLKTLRLVKR